MMAGGAVSASAAELETPSDSVACQALPLMPASKTEDIAGEESNIKRVLPPKKQKVKAEQEYKTHTLGTLQYQCPASWNEFAGSYDSTNADWYLYEDEHLYLNVYVRSNTADMGFLNLTEEQIAEYQKADLPYGLAEKVTIRGLNPNRNFKGVDLQYFDDGYYICSSIVGGENNSIRFFAMADKFGKDAMEEYKNKILYSVKKIPADDRTVIEKDSKPNPDSPSGIGGLEYLQSLEDNRAI